MEMGKWWKGVPSVPKWANFGFYEVGGDSIDKCKKVFQKGNFKEKGGGEKEGGEKEEKE